MTDKLTSDVNVRGVSLFFYGLVPWALSLGAAGWLAFYAGVHDAEQRAAAEKRVAVAVGEENKPTAPYKITLDQRHFFIEKARYDGHTLEVYYRNKDSARLYNYCWYVKQKGADGTIIGNTSACFPESERALEPGERSELRTDFDADSRTTEIVVGFDEPLRGNK
jgi:hypothetical protein